MTDLKTPCQHEQVWFQSGDYYVACLKCGHRWVTINLNHEPDPTLANQGFKCTNQRRDQLADGK